MQLGNLWEFVFPAGNHLIGGKLLQLIPQVMNLLVLSLKCTACLFAKKKHFP